MLTNNQFPTTDNSSFYCSCLLIGGVVCQKDVKSCQRPSKTLSAVICQVAMVWHTALLRIVPALYVQQTVLLLAKETFWHFADVVNDRNKKLGSTKRYWAIWWFGPQKRNRNHEGRCLHKAKRHSRELLVSIVCIAACQILPEFSLVHLFI